MEASRPTTRPAASIITHFFSTSAGFAEYVRMVSSDGLSMIPRVRQTRTRDQRLIHQQGVPGQRFLSGVVQQNQIVIKMVLYYLQRSRPNAAFSSCLAFCSVRRRVAGKLRPARFM